MTARFDASRFSLSRSLRRVFLATILLAAIPSPGRAEGAAPKAVNVGHRGLVAFEAGNFAEAARLFAEAELLAHSPVFLLYLARASLALGDLARARFLLLRTAEEPLSETTPPAFERAVTTARRERLDLEERFRFVRARFAGDFLFPVVARIGERTVTLEGPLVDFVYERELHSVEFVDRRGRTSTHSLPETPDDRQEWIVSRPERLPSLGNRLRSAPALLPPAPIPSDAGVHPYRVGAYVAFGVTGLGVLAGTTAGVAAWLRAESVHARCDENGLCPAEEARNAEEATRLANFATVGFLSAGVGLVTGATLLGLEAIDRSLRLELHSTGVRASGHF